MILRFLRALIGLHQPNPRESDLRQRASIVAQSAHDQAALLRKTPLTLRDYHRADGYLRRPR